MHVPEIYDPSDSGFKEAQSLLEFHYYAVEWLVESGYISATPHRFDGFSDAVLTAKGLEVLKLRPSSLNSSFGDELMQASKSGTREVIKDVTSSLLSTGITFLLNKFMYG